MALELTKGLLTVIKAKIGENLFAEHFPELCYDSPNPPIGTDAAKLKDGLAAYQVIYPDDWPKYENGDYSNYLWPTGPQVFDLVEFLYEHAGMPHGYARHSFFGHDHLSFDKEKGRAQFETDIHRFFERNGLAFELKGGGHPHRADRIAGSARHQCLQDGRQGTRSAFGDRAGKVLEQVLGRAKGGTRETLGRLGTPEDR